MLRRSHVDAHRCPVHAGRDEGQGPAGIDHVVVEPLVAGRARGPLPLSWRVVPFRFPERDCAATLTSRAWLESLVS
jgi:hypothetical protein